MMYVHALEKLYPRMYTLWYHRTHKWVMGHEIIKELKKPTFSWVSQSRMSHNGDLTHDSPSSRFSSLNNRTRSYFVSCISPKCCWLNLLWIVTIIVFSYCKLARPQNQTCCRNPRGNSWGRSLPRSTIQWISIMCFDHLTHDPSYPKQFFF